MYFVGLDLGQKTDHSALAVVKRAEIQWPMNPQVVDRVREVVRNKELRETGAVL